MKWKGAKSDGDYEPAPTGTHIARCIRLIDLGTQQSEFEGRITSRRQVMVTWELPQELMTTGDHAGEPYSVNKWYTQSLHVKANLRHDLEAWRGRAFTDEELEGFDAKTILGAPCLISVIHTEQGKARVNSVMAVPKGTKAPKQHNPSIFFSLDVDEFDPGVFETLSDYLKATIQGSPEFLALRTPTTVSQVDPQRESDEMGAWINEDDIPF